MIFQMLFSIDSIIKLFNLTKKIIDHRYVSITFSFENFFHVYVENNLKKSV